MADTKRAGPRQPDSDLRYPQPQEQQCGEEGTTVIARLANHRPSDPAPASAAGGEAAAPPAGDHAGRLAALETENALLHAEVAALKRAQKDDQAERVRLQTILDTLPAGVAILDASGRVLQVNDLYGRIWGGSTALPSPLPAGIAETAEFRAWWADTGAQIAPEEWASARALRRGETSIGEAIDILRFDGTRGTILNSAAPLRDAEGNTIGAVVAIQDISERAAMLDALRRSEERLRVVLGHAGITVFAQDRDLRYTWLHNPHPSFSDERHLGRADGELFPPEYAEPLVAVKQSVLDTGQATRCEVRLPMAGEVLTYDLIVEPLRDAQGGVTGVLGASVDITERRRAEEERARRLERMKRLVGVLGEVLAASTVESLLQKVVDAAVTVTGAGSAATGHGFRDGTFRVVAAAADPGVLIGVPDGAFAMERGGVALRILRDGAALRLSEHDLPRDPDGWGLPEGHAPLRGLLGVPLMGSDGRPAGVILATDKKEGEFTEEDEALLSQLGLIASLGLQHIEARLDAEHRAEEVQALMDAVPAAVWIAHDPECLRITGSRVSYEMLRMPPGANASKTAPEEERPAHFRAMRGGIELPTAELPVQQAAATGRPVLDTEFEVLFEDGTRRHLFGNAVPLLDGADRPRGAVAAFVDITERVRAEDALRGSEHRLRTVLDALPVGVWLTDSRGAIVFANPAGRRIWGGARYVGLEAYGEYKGWWVDTGERIAAEEWPLARALTHGETRLNDVIEIECFDGTRKTILNSALPVRDGDGGILGAVVVNEDITERRRTEDAIRRAHDRFEILSETAGRLLMSPAPQQIVNDLCRRVMEHLDCHVFFNFLVDEDAGRLHLNACAGIPDGTAREIEWLDLGVAVCGCVARDGCRLVVEDIQHSDDPRADLVRSFGVQAYACHPLLMQGKVIGTLSFGSRARPAFAEEDLSLMKMVADQVAMAMERIRLLEAAERRANEAEAAGEALREANRRKDEFLAMLSHELRNPLAAISGAVQFLRLRGLADPSLNRATEAADRQVRHMARLLDDLLDVARVTRGKVTLKKQPVDLRDVVTHGLQTASSLLQERRHEVVVDLAADPLPLNADPDRLAQVVANLLSNAARYTPPEGGISLHAYRDGDAAVLAVRDSGQGIPTDLLPHVFDLFVQGERALDRREGGLGIGLTMVRALVEMHAGTVEAFSGGAGQGSEFVVRLPLEGSGFGVQ